MKMSLCQMIAIVCLLAVVAIVVAPLQVVRANGFVHHVEVYIDRVTHDNGTVTHTTTRVVRFLTIHVAPGPGSHQHPSPTCTPHFKDVSCSNSQCYYCS